MRVVALGRTGILWKSITQLHNEGHEVALIATCKSAPEYDVREEHFENLAKQINCQFLLTQSLNKPEIVHILRKTQADIAISVNWINVVGSEACNVFKHGILNAHAGDLPRYRGNAPIAWAILQGESKVGLTIHRMEPYELDSGAIYIKDYYQLSDQTYINEVLSWVETRTPELFLDVLNGIQNGVIEPEKQPSDPALALHCYSRRPEDGRIYWNKSVNYLARLVRASSEPYAGAFTYLDGEKLTIWRARKSTWDCPSLAIPGQVLWKDKSTGEVGIASSDGVLILEVIESQTQGRVKPTTILTSLRMRLTDFAGSI